MALDNSRTPDRRDDGVTLIAIGHFITAAIFAVGAAVLAFPTLILGFIALSQAPPVAIGMIFVGLGAAVATAFAMIYIAVGYGLWKMSAWARIAAMALSMLILLLFPVGTVIGGLILWHLAKPSVAAKFEQIA